MTEILLAYGTALIVALTGGAVFAWNKRTERLHHLMLDRREAYRRYLDTMAKLLSAAVRQDQDDEAQFRRDFARCRYDLTLVAGDEVLGRVCKSAQMFMELLDEIDEDKKSAEYEGPEVDHSAFSQSLASLIVEMRRDCFQRMHITEQEVEELLPIYSRQIVVFEPIEVQA